MQFITYIDVQINSRLFLSVIIAIIHNFPWRFDNWDTSVQHMIMSFKELIWTKRFSLCETILVMKNWVFEICSAVEQNYLRLFGISIWNATRKFNGEVRRGFF